MSDNFYVHEKMYCNIYPHVYFCKHCIYCKHTCIVIRDLNRDKWNLCPTVRASKLDILETTQTEYKGLN